MPREEFNPDLLKVKKEVIVNSGEKTETAAQLISYNGGDDKVRVVIRGLNGKWENVLWKSTTPEITRKVIAGIDKILGTKSKKS